MPGKKFEQDLVEAFKKTEALSYDRFQDPGFGFAANANICDFVLYRHPYQIYLEAKTVKNDTLDIGNIKEGMFRNISKRQYYGLKDKADISGVFAGIIVEFRRESKNLEREYYYIPIQELEYMVLHNKKSLNVKDVNKWEGIIRVNAKRKVTRYAININKLLNEISNTMWE